MVISRVPRFREQDYKVRSAFDLKKTTGDVGIEIELEGTSFPKTKTDFVSDFWGYHADHSLRGMDNAEYVLKKPIKFNRVAEATDELFTKLSAWGSELDDSNRTSVHLHLNVQEWYMNRLASFAALYFSVEELLTEWAGEHRVGNLFCLRAKDAPGIITCIREFIKTGGRHPISDHFHYAAFNIQAILKFGSIEVRQCRGATDPLLVQDWVALLRRIYELSADFKDPRDVIGMFSCNGPAQYLREVFGETLPILLSGIDWYEDRVRDSLYEGIRFAQEIVFCRDWSTFKEMKEDDPFDRTPSKKKEALYASIMMEGGAAMPPPPQNIPMYTLNPLGSISIPQWATAISDELTLNEEEHEDEDEEPDWSYDEEEHEEEGDF